MSDFACFISFIAMSVSVVALSRVRKADMRADDLYWDYIRLWNHVLDAEDGLRGKDGAE